MLLGWVTCLLCVTLRWSGDLNVWTKSAHTSVGKGLFFYSDGVKSLHYMFIVVVPSRNVVNGVNEQFMFLACSSFVVP